jgi:prepilin-type processing-associated H-X9-DG protein
LFSLYTCYRTRDVTDGTSNTIAMGEFARATTSTSFGSVAVIGAGSTTAACNATFNKGTMTYINASSVFTSDTWRGYRWGDGRSYFAAINTNIPPNSASCIFSSTEGHWGDGIFSMGSYHTGGGHVLMADGAVRFISQNINAGNQAAKIPAATVTSASPYGVWGALGTKAGAEPISLPE